MDGSLGSRELQTELQAIIDQTGLYFETAKDQFEDSQISLTNPELIDDEISQQKSVFSKLKFIYLEQETRDKFLRRISESDIQDVNQDEVMNMKSVSERSKLGLKELKSNMYIKIGELEELTNNIGQLYENYHDKINDTKSLINEMELLQQEIDSELNGGNQEYNEILKAVPLTKSVDLSQYITSTDSNLNQLKLESNSLDDKINQLETTLNNQIESIKQLKARFVELTDQITANPVGKNDKQQLFAKWCRETIDILIRLSNLNNITIKILQHDLFQLSISWSQSNQLIIEFDDNFTIVKVLGTDKPFPSMIPITEDSFIQALVEFVTKLSQQN